MTVDAPSPQTRVALSFGRVLPVSPAPWLRAACFRSVDERAELAATADLLPGLDRRPSRRSPLCEAPRRERRRSKHAHIPSNASRPLHAGSFFQHVRPRVGDTAQDACGAPGDPRQLTRSPPGCVSPTHQLLHPQDVEPSQQGLPSLVASVPEASRQRLPQSGRRLIHAAASVRSEDAGRTPRRAARHGGTDRRLRRACRHANSSKAPARVQRACPCW